MGVYGDETLKKFLLVGHLEGKVVTNVPLLVIHHSPDGFNFGYAGSGPADLALNWLEWYCHEIMDWQLDDQPRVPCFQHSCFRLAWQLHQAFKFQFIAPLKDNVNLISFAKLDLWVREQIAANPELVSSEEPILE